MAVVATQLVPLALKIVPVPVAVDGYAAVENEGADERPLLCKTTPDVEVGDTAEYPEAPAPTIT